MHSGTDKIATFVIGALQRIDYSNHNCQALILAPTCKLAQQIQKVFLDLDDYVKIRCHSCIGGISVRDDIDRLRDGQQCVVGTPGRKLDMISKRQFRVSSMLTFVLDDTDEMLSRGF